MRGGRIDIKEAAKVYSGKQQVAQFLSTPALVQIMLVYFGIPLILLSNLSLQASRKFAPKK